MYSQRKSQTQRRIQQAADSLAAGFDLSCCLLHRNAPQSILHFYRMQLFGRQQIAHREIQILKLRIIVVVQDLLHDLLARQICVAHLFVRPLFSALLRRKNA